MMSFFGATSAANFCEDLQMNNIRKSGGHVNKKKTFFLGGGGGVDVLLLP
jgi:hypothetical protein